MKKFVVVIILLAAAVIVIATRATSAPGVSVRDVRHAESLILGQESGNSHPWGIWIEGSGHVDGEATISLLLHGQPYKVERVRGRVEFEWGGDWYAETATVRYEPVNVRSGTVVLRYRFYK